MRIHKAWDLKNHHGKLKESLTEEEALNGVSRLRRAIKKRGLQGKALQYLNHWGRGGALARQDGKSREEASTLKNHSSTAWDDRSDPDMTTTARNQSSKDKRSESDLLYTTSHMLQERLGHPSLSIRSVETEIQRKRGKEGVMKAKWDRKETEAEQRS